MSRVALVLAGPYPHSRGSQMLVRQMADGLRARGHEVVVIAHGPDTPSAPRLNLGRVFRGLALARALWRANRNGALDLVHAHNYEAALIALPIARLFGIPLVFHGHAAYRDELPGYVPRWCRYPAERVGGWLDRRVPCLADAVVAVTASLADRLVANGVPPSQVTHIPPALAPEEPPVATAAAEVSGRVCYAGNLDDYQNLAFLRAAFAQVRAVVPEAELLIVTDEVRGGREEWNGIPGVSVRWQADIETVRRWLATAAVAVVPRTDSTGFPMKVLNYRAAAKAIVVCRGAAHGLEHGREAWVVPDADEKSFAAAIVTLLRDPVLRGQLGAATRRAIQPDAVEAGLDQLESIYRRLYRQTVPRLRPITQSEQSHVEPS